MREGLTAHNETSELRHECTRVHCARMRASRVHARDELRRTPGSHGRTAHLARGRLAPAFG